MSVRRILAKTIDTDLEYEAIGIDLAKNCVSARLHGERRRTKRLGTFLELRIVKPVDADHFTICC